MACGSVRARSTTMLKGVPPTARTSDDSIPRPAPLWSESSVKEFRVRDLTINSDLTVNIRAQEYDYNIFNWGAKDPEPTAAPVVDTKPVEPIIVDEGEEDDTMSYFQKLANE